MTKAATPAKTQVKPLTAYAELDPAQKRFCNKLIMSCHNKELNDAATHSINSAVNRARRESKPVAKGKYVNGYMLFYQDSVPKLRKAHKDIDVTGMAKRVSANWKELSALEKAKYKEKAKKLRANA
jgi:hypothetical protein